MESQIQYSDGYFFVKGTYPNPTLRDNGFKYDPGKGLWWTRSHLDVEKVGGMSAQTQEKVELFNKNLRDSTVDTSREVFSAPPGKEYYPFQKAGIRYLLDHKTSLLADSPGLGKTIQVIGMINNDISLRRILILAPSSMVYQWVKELEQWCTRDLYVEGYKPSKPVTLDQNTIAVMTYRRMFTVHPHLSAINWDLVVLDEGHYIKNVQAVRTTYITGAKNGNDWLIKPITGKKRIVITGTPILNRPEELWTILNFLEPDIWWSRDDFLRRYCENTDHLEELKTRLRSTIMLRRDKNTVLPELPKKRHHIIYLFPLNLTRTNNRLYKSYYNQIKVYKDNGTFEECLKNRDTNLWAAMTELAKMRKELASLKITPCFNILDMALSSEECKIVFFAHHKILLESIYNQFKSKAVILTGDTPPNKRQEVVEKFQTDPSCKLFVGSIQAAGYGITLTAATNVIFGEMDWVPANMEQCADRCCRIGSDHSVLIQYVVWQDTLEHAMASRLVEKQELINKVLT